MSAHCRMVCLLSAGLLCAGVGRAGESRLEQRVYAVTDLVIAVDGAAKDDKPAATRATGWAVSREREPKVVQVVRVTKNAPATTHEDRLIKLITHTIAPRSWDGHGGRGTIDYHPLTMALIINQTPAIQDQIADLLASLRRLQDMEVAVEVKFVSITDEVLRDLQQKDMLGKPDTKKKGHDNVTFLNDTGMLRFMEAIQSDIHSSVMQAPKLTMFNGQKTGIDISDKQSFVTGLEIVHSDDHIEYRPKTEIVPLGVRLGLRSVCAPDCRLVRVDLDAMLSNLESGDVPKFPITTPAAGNPISPDGKPRTETHYIQQPKIIKVGVKRTLVIPDGCTAVLMGGARKMIAASESRVPILGDVPIVGRLFCSYECHDVTQHLLVMVTPRIIIQKEEEEKQTGYVPPPAVVP